MVAPAAQSFHLITQNVDRLSTRAALDLSHELSNQGKTSREYQATEGSLLEMHGKLFEVKCTECDWKTDVPSNPLTTALGVADADIRDYTTAGSKSDIPLDELPRCPMCGSLARPGVVWFGEIPHHLDTINSLVNNADLCLVVGTSSTARDHQS